MDNRPLHPKEGKLRGEELAGRLIDFSARIINLAKALEKAEPEKVILRQLLRSGTSAGANYEEARAAESKKDFIHKLGICLKELRETRYWLLVIQRAELLPEKRLQKIVGESDELCKIVAKSIISARK